MADQDNSNEKKSGENPDGKFHFNPGNMAGKPPSDPKQTAENRKTQEDTDKGSVG
ncbi:hypothetical protein ABIF65_005631 [Bradyrhizobium japonicum]|jgi:hypothetical protein|uniref:hypothetical protein n=1 Tax=Bradyrhizobium TaxID=374 RepID=UPI001872ED67|nr:MULTISPECIES: hypothetical protein [Bradyrhizobium]MBR0883147.1 hypothetical protein [Bradyrhizobium liaoningense]MBR0947234.1 hypothetical protein [Bradyrhizobium liaoningense]MBR1003355.1 hypothetical protein [Bradyrhizobium liaoningense]MBR1069912.1 hypothetical protein [Bradyrhizobium liaoningense]MCP1743964.1 hypothetical protein [Bradyrhizobium japonicum]